MLQGTPNTLEGVRATAAKAGIDKKAVEEIYNRYGANAKARMVCQMIGTTPEALRDDALAIVGGAEKAKAAAPMTSRKFPRLK
jgi:hypothetical protein